jgi:ABC-type long-subunit fatty acid transport system fused permease/ATPase subunit
MEVLQVDEYYMRWVGACKKMFFATVTDVRHLEGVHAMLKEDCTMMCTLTAAEVVMSTASVFHIPTRQLGKRKVCAKSNDSMHAA